MSNYAAGEITNEHYARVNEHHTRKNRIFSQAAALFFARKKNIMFSEG